MLSDTLIAELSQEAANTRRVLERVPESRMSWKPHAKSMSLGQLAHHVANVPGAIADLVSADVRDLPVVPRPEARSVAELLATLEKSIANAKAKLASWDDAALMASFKLMRNGQAVIELPRIAMIRTVMLNHWYHHRGQLTVYLRLLDVPLPAIYGGSADENPFR
jgi:uncharacterized damage-inducible protein DinB